MVNRRRGASVRNARAGSAQTPNQRGSGPRAGSSRGEPTRARARNVAQAPSHVAQPGQCKAVTKQGERCRRSVAPGSKHLCTTHEQQLARGSEVRNYETGRKFPAPRR